MLKSVKKNDSADEAIQKENDELRAKIQEAIAESDEVEPEKLFLKVNPVFSSIIGINCANVIFN